MDVNSSVPHPRHDLFLWCLLFRRPEMAQVLWRKADDGLAFAIAAALLCRRAAALDQRDTDIQV